MSVAEHKALSPSPGGVRVALLTASDSRTSGDNEGGAVLRRLAVDAGFSVVEEALLREEPDALRARVEALAAGGVDAVLVTGGTGLGPRDRTPEAVAPLFERRLEGFGELFRALSFAEIGPAAMLSRADAGSPITEPTGEPDWLRSAMAASRSASEKKSRGTGRRPSGRMPLE